MKSHTCSSKPSSRLQFCEDVIWAVTHACMHQHVNKSGKRDNQNDQEGCLGHGENFATAESPNVWNANGCVCRARPPSLS